MKQKTVTDNSKQKKSIKKHAKTLLYVLFCGNLMITFRMCFCIFILTGFSFSKKWGKSIYERSMQKIKNVLL